MAFLEDLATQRQKFLDGLEANKDDINLRIFEDFYPDEAHFIFELLQNAEDTGATTVSFTLTTDRCVFEHNGERHFGEDDVRAITGISNSTKTNRPDEIGKFGMGFKSVFAYTEAPTIYSRDFSFQIRKLVLPVAVPQDSSHDGWTRFELPFNNPRKLPDIAYKDIAVGLERLPDTTLLFLPNLRSIRWHTGSESSGAILRVQHSEDHIEVLKEVGDKTIVSSHFLRFSAPVEGLTKQNVAIAFALDFLPKVTGFDPMRPIAEQLKIVPIAGQVAVYFPAVKESSGLRFHLHAPFVPELSRASVKETPVNKPLFSQLAQLAATSLHIIRDLGLLTGEFLAVLPNPLDNLPPRYRPIRDEIIEEMKNQPLTPTHSRPHAPAKQLLQAVRSLKDLLTDDDLKQLLHIDGKPPYWAIGSGLNNSDQDRFLTGLGIIKWDIQNFVEKLSSPGFQQWLSTKPVDWHQQMYALLYDYYRDDSWLKATQEQFKKLPIIRLSDGSHSTGDKCYFPSAGVDSDPEFPRVDQRVYSSGNNKAQQEKARKLLETIGVRDVGETEQVQSILKQRYTNGAVKPDDQTYLDDLKRFITLIEAQPNCGSMFQTYYIFKRACSDWGTPAQVVLDRPYLDTGLAAYFNAVGSVANKAALSDWYQSIPIPVERLRSFAQATGALYALSIETGNCKNNSREDYLYQAKGRKRESGIDRDYYIPYLYRVLDAKNIEVSRLIWNTMCRDSAGKLEATYRKSNTGEQRTASSNVIQWLESKAWIPQLYGDQVHFVRPREASRSRLPDDRFPFSEDSEWLKAVRFGENERHQSEEHKKRQATFRELGFADDAAFCDAQQFAKLPSEQRRLLLDEYDRKSKFELPEATPTNPERRAERVAQQAAEAPERITEKRLRSVSVGREAVKQETEPYLRAQYTHADGQMICQVCQDALPFKLDDGDYYFEMVEFLREPDLQKRHYQDYLSLCPNHAAMYKHANGSREVMKALFQGMQGHELAVVLAQENTTIYFTDMHMLDLRAVISADEDGRPEQ